MHHVISCYACSFALQHRTKLQAMYWSEHCCTVTNGWHTDRDVAPLGKACSKYSGMVERSYMGPICCCVQQWSSVTVASAFRGWAEHVAEAAESRAKVQTSLVRLLHRSLYSAFAAWREAAAVQAEQRGQVMSCIARLTQRVSVV